MIRWNDAVTLTGYNTLETAFDVILESHDSIAQCCSITYCDVIIVMRCDSADDEDDDQFSYHGNEDADGSSTASAAWRPTAAPSRDYDDNNNKSTLSYNFPRPGDSTVLRLL